MSGAKVIEISASSTKSFEDAILAGVARHRQHRSGERRLDHGAEGRHRGRQDQGLAREHERDVCGGAGGQAMDCASVQKKAGPWVGFLV